MLLCSSGPYLAVLFFALHIMHVLFLLIYPPFVLALDSLHWLSACRAKLMQSRADLSLHLCLAHIFMLLNKAVGIAQLYRYVRYTCIVLKTTILEVNTEYPIGILSPVGHLDQKDLSCDKEQRSTSSNSSCKGFTGRRQVTNY